MWSFWNPFSNQIGFPGKIRGHLGAVLGVVLGCLGQSWGLGALLAGLEPVLGSHGVILSCLGAISDRSWPFFGQSCGGLWLLGAVLSGLAAALCGLGTILGHLKPLWPPPEGRKKDFRKENGTLEDRRHIGQREAILGSLGKVSKRSCSYLEVIVGGLWGARPFPSPTAGLGGQPATSKIDLEVCVCVCVCAESVYRFSHQTDFMVPSDDQRLNSKRLKKYAHMEVVVKFFSGLLENIDL